MEKLFEKILRLFIERLAELFGIPAVPPKQLVKFFTEELEELDIPGTCGKVRLAAQKRGSRLCLRLSLSTEMVEIGCPEKVIQWANERYEEAMRTIEGARGALYIVIHQTRTVGEREERELLSRIPPAT